MVRTYYQQKSDERSGPVVIGKRAAQPFSDAERRKLAEDEQKRILDEQVCLHYEQSSYHLQIAEKKRQRMAQQAQEQAEILNHYRNYPLAGDGQQDRDLEAFIQENQRQPMMYQPPPPSFDNYPSRNQHYGAAAAHITDKMESDRDRRLRLRAQERAAAQAARQNEI